MGNKETMLLRTCFNAPGTVLVAVMKADEDWQEAEKKKTRPG